MLLLARLAALSIGIAVLVLFVLPALVSAPETDDGSGRSDVKIARNTTWDGNASDGRATASGEAGSQNTTSSWGERAPTPQSELSRADWRMPAPPAGAGASRLADASEEVKRFAAIEKGHAITIKPAGRKRFYRVIVQDAGTLKTGNHIIHLKGISVRDEDETCKDESGKEWPCGTRARAALTRLIRGRAVVCDLPPRGDRPEFAARCRIGETDLSLWMVERGWAKPDTENDDTLAKARDKAKQAQVGLWGGPGQFRSEPVYNEPVPIFEQEPIYDDDDPLYPGSEPIYDQ
ncbi:thermonuclease family protein [Methyloligella solikamskensis]|uniref:Thermonuclease family protein n=1 Tax=Methyloligella solikamskensis TaxID=1177756 RepID=A0ABW3JFM6_9HYPH